MAMNIYSSTSIQYLLTKWFDKVTEKQIQYTELLTNHIETSNKKVLGIALELQKMQNKIVTPEALAKKAELINNVSQIEPDIILLIEFIYSYKNLMDEIEGFNLELTSRKNILKLIKSEIEYLNNLTISLRNLIKSINAVFKYGSKPKKKNEVEFEQFLKYYSKLLRNLGKEFSNFKLDFQNLINKLEIEVELAKIIDEEIIE